MKKKNLVVLLLLLLLVGAGVYTYSRYTSTFEGSGNLDVAKWAVTVTGADAQTKEFNLEFTPVANENVVSGKIAPGSSATGKIELDLTGTEVATDYTVTIGDLTDIPEGFAVTSIKAGDTVLDENNNYTGTVTLAEIEANAKVELIITVTWENKEANNADDTAIGLDGNSIEIPVTVLVQQHIGE